MRYWFDTEFIEDGKTIDLTSIGVVAEDGREYYAINQDCDFSKASDWVKDNVLTQLPPRDSTLWKAKSLIRAEVAAFLGADSFMFPLNPVGWNGFLYDFYAKCPSWIEKALKWIPGLKPRTKFTTSYKLNPDKMKPEIWAYYADYDWVAFCQLFGTMMDLPKGFPMYCRDIKQWADMLGNPKLPEQDKGEHSALEDARWNRKAWRYLDGLCW
jgi:hypothetical protein